jgi:hypothetical protein
MDEDIRELIASGASIRELAGRWGVSYGTARRRLLDAGVRTRAAAQRSAAREARDAGGDEVALECPVHGRTPHRRRPRGSYACLRCRSESVARRRRKVKAILVAEAGGQCRLCGYDRHPAALQFHHLEREGKRFSLSQQGVARSLERARAEARKCVLLCANCHAEVEAGAREVSLR